jgi:crotonobetainyl-CoA:carnitine CoA-transferase CaiB-like acyl-CoA transferase
MTRTGPLGGITVVELGGIGPTPFACMLLADLGAQVTRVKRAVRPHAGRRSWRSRTVASGSWSWI